MTSMVGMAGGIVGGIGTWLAGEQQANVYLANSQNAERDKRMAREAGQAEAADIRYEANFIKGTIVARGAAMGWALDTGAAPPAEGYVPTDTGTALLMEAERRATQAESRAIYAAEVEATRYDYEAGLYKRMAASTRLNGIIGGWSQALSSSPSQAAQPANRTSYSVRAEQAYQDYRAGERGLYGDSASNAQTPEPGANLGTTGSAGASEDWNWSW